MKKEHISNRQLFSIMVLFIVGSSLIVGVAAQVKIDKWISVLIAAAAAVPVFLMYIKLLALFPEKNLFDIFHIVLGKWVGPVFVLLYTWFAFHLGALVLRNFGEFVNTVAMPETPLLVPIILLALVCIWGIKEGVEVLGRIARFFLPTIVLIIVVVQILCIPQYDTQFLKPVLGEGWIPVLKGAVSTFTFPFAEAVLFTTIYRCRSGKKPPYKTLIGSLVLGAAIIMTATLRNIMVLGATLEQNPYFPSYIAVGRIRIGVFLQRIEITVSLVFVIGAFIKISVCLLAACNGVKKLAKLSDHRSVVLPVGILMAFLAYTIYENSMEMVRWAFNVYSYYALPFQVVFPLLLLLYALYKKHKQDKKTLSQNQPARADAQPAQE